jgi:hypothetical protein
VDIQQFRRPEARLSERPSTLDADLSWSALELLLSLLVTYGYYELRTCGVSDNDFACGATSIASFGKGVEDAR